MPGLFYDNPTFDPENVLQMLQSPRYRRPDEITMDDLNPPQQNAQPQDQGWQPGPEDPMAGQQFPAEGWDPNAQQPQTPSAGLEGMAAPEPPMPQEMWGAPPQQSAPQDPLVDSSATDSQSMAPPMNSEEYGETTPDNEAIEGESGPSAPQSVADGAPAWLPSNAGQSSGVVSAPTGWGMDQNGTLAKDFSQGFSSEDWNSSGMAGQMDPRTPGEPDIVLGTPLDPNTTMAQLEAESQSSRVRDAEDAAQIAAVTSKPQNDARLAEITAQQQGPANVARINVGGDLQRETTRGMLDIGNTVAKGLMGGFSHPSSTASTDNTVLNTKAAEYKVARSSYQKALDDVAILGGDPNTDPVVQRAKVELDQKQADLDAAQANPHQSQDWTPPSVAVPAVGSAGKPYSTMTTQEKAAAFAARAAQYIKAGMPAKDAKEKALSELRAGR